MKPNAFEPPTNAKPATTRAHITRGPNLYRLDRTIFDPTTKKTLLTKSEYRNPKNNNVKDNTRATKAFSLGNPQANNPNSN